jgi:hypothetical protein
MQRRVGFGSDEPLFSLVMPRNQPTELLLALSSSRLCPSGEESLYCHWTTKVVPAAAPTSAARTAPSSKTTPKPLAPSHTRYGAVLGPLVIDPLGTKPMKWGGMTSKWTTERRR